MAAHKENVSQNRRRLFKALSATPVVATLSPGSAIASHSAYQCAANLRDEPLPSPGPNDAPTGVFEQVALLTWVLTTADRQDRPETSDPTDLVGLGGTGISTTDLAVGITVVSMDPDNPANGPFYELDGSNFQDRFDPTTVARVEVSGTTMTIFNQRTSAPYTNGRATIVSTGAIKYYVSVYQTSEGSCGPGVKDCNVSYIGTYPQVQVDHSVIGSADAGAPQGMSGTCLGSFVDAGHVGLTPP